MAIPPVPVSRRPLSKGDRREQAILAAADRLLAEKSLAEISVDELAAGAGISRPSFYFYFSSKEAVLRALVYNLSHVGIIHGESGHTLEESLRLNLARLVRRWSESGHVLRAAYLARESVPELEEQWEAEVNRFVDTAAAAITRDRESGRALPGPPSARSLAAALTAMNERCLMAFIESGGSAIPAPELIDTLMLVWLRAIYGADRALIGGPR